MTPRWASHSRVAFSINVSRTGSRSNVERLMTFSTSLVAVCCSSASVSSRLRACSSWNRRTFSMAITAWSAKVFNSSMWLGLNGPGVARETPKAPIGTRRASSERQVAAAPPPGRRLVVVGIRFLRDVDGRPLEDRSSRGQLSSGPARIELWHHASRPPRAAC